MGNVSIEDAIISSLLINWDIEISPLWLDVEYFASTNNKIIFQVAKELENSWIPRDIVTVSNKIKELYPNCWITNKLLVELTSAEVLSSNILVYTKKLKDWIRAKEVGRIAEELLLTSSTWAIDNNTIFSITNKLMGKLSTDSEKYDINDDTFDNFYEYLQEREGKSLFWYSFWKEFSFLDESTKWLQKWRTYRIGATSNLGKSQFLYWIINNVLDQWAKVAFFTLENDKPFTLVNLMASKMRCNSHSIEKWEVSPDAEYLGSLKSRLFIIDDVYDMSEIFTQVLSIKPDLVFIDYIGLVNIKWFTEEAKYWEYAKQVQRFVKKTRVSWVDLSNLPNNIEEETIRTHWNFYGSSFLKNQCDVGIHMMYYHPFYEWKKAMEESPTHITKLREDAQYKSKMTNVKGIVILIQKSRIWPAMIEESFLVNFNEGARFTAFTEEQKNKFKNTF